LLQHSHLLILKEDQKQLVWLIIVILFIAIFIIDCGIYGSGSFLGDMIALGCAVSAITALYAIASAPILALDSTQLIYLSVQCLVFIPLAYAIIIIAPRFTSSAEVQLVFLLESILGSLGVCVVISETPPINTIIGGSLLLASVSWFAIASAGESADEVKVEGITT
jgi:drug/metabolite transporter (DMT)-like permease